MFREGAGPRGSITAGGLLYAAQRLQDSMQVAGPVQTMCACLATAASTYSTSAARTPPCPPRRSAAPWHDLVRKEGRFLRLSEVGEQPIRRAHAVHPIAVLQTGYRESSTWA